MSTAQKRGAAYDNEIANELEESTGDDVAVHSMRGSGNTKHPQPDVLVRGGGERDPFADVRIQRAHHDVALELKRSSVKTGEHYYIEGEDLVQLAKCRNEITHAYLGIKLTRRELVVVWLPQHVDVETVVSTVADAIPDAFDPHVTDGGNLRVTKPTTSVWPSATVGRDDVEVLAEALNLTLE